MAAVEKERESRPQLWKKERPPILFHPLHPEREPERMTKIRICEGRARGRTGAWDFQIGFHLVVAPIG